MVHLENKIFKTCAMICTRYIDNIFVQAKILDEIKNMKPKGNFWAWFHSLKNELSINNIIPFYDVLADSNNHKFASSVYEKPTSNKSCLHNYHNECTQIYKLTVIKKWLIEPKWSPLHIHWSIKNCKLLVTVVEGDPKAPFSIATKPRCREGNYSFLWIVPLTLILTL